MTRLKRQHFLLSEAPVNNSPLLGAQKRSARCLPSPQDENYGLRVLNIVAFTLHSIFAIVTLSVGIAGKSPFSLVVTRSLPMAPSPVPEPFNSPTCGNKTYDDVFKWFDCISAENEYRVDLVEQNGYKVITGDAQAPDAVLPPFQTDILIPSTSASGEVRGEWAIWTLIFAFCALTAMFHALLAWSFVGPYNDMLKSNRQPLRYLEYSITASIMMVIVLSLSRVTDVYLLWANLLLMACVNVLGGLIEWIDFPAGRCSPELAVRLWGWVVSFVVFVFQFVQLWDIFDVTVSPWLSDSNPTSELFGQLFNFVRILNWAILLSFCVFPLINVVHQGLLISGKDDVGVAVEMAYVVASLVAKGALVFIVFAGSIRRD